MALLKIKQIVEDLERNTSQQVGTVTKNMSSMEGVAGTSKYAGTAFTFSAAQLRAMFNRVLAGTNLVICGTGIGTVGDAVSWGVTIFPACAIINGKIGTIGTCAQLNPPGLEAAGVTKRGTQAAATYVKYLISSGFGSSGTITAGPEAASSTAAKLPDVPENHVALGFVEVKAHATNKTIWYDGGNGTFHPFTGAPNTTSGTSVVNGAVVGVGVSGFTQLGSMPFLE